MSHHPLELEEVLRLWQSPGRYYHTLTHLKECLSSPLLAYVGDAEAVRLALLFHDCVYVAGGRHCEEMSAETFTRFAMRTAVMSGPNMERMIEISNWIRRSSHNDASMDNLSESGRIFLDIDLSILASNSNRFSAYEMQIRAEYEKFPLKEYLEGRRAFLTGMLRRPRIFSSVEGYRRYEVKARRNLKKSLRVLEIAGR